MTLSRVIVAVCVCILIAWSLAAATPLHPTKSSNDNKKGARWPSGSVINVYIEPDTTKPDGVDRSQLIKEGIERWTDEMAARGVTINVTVGTAPAGTANVVNATWEPNGTQVGGLTLGSENNAIGTSSVSGDNITGGAMYFSDDAFGEMVSGAHQDTLKNIAEHEFCHVLGLADDDKGAVTNHTQEFGEEREMNDQDKKELNDIYGTGNSSGTQNAQGVAQHTGGGAGGAVSYRFDFVPGNPVPDPDDPEHVAFIAIGIPPEFVTDVVTPPGWIASAPQGPLTKDDPFFTTDDYMVDGTPIPTVWGGAPPRFVALRASAAEAVTDGIPETTDAALSLDTPVLNVDLVLAPGLADCWIEVWAGGEIQIVPGPFAIGPVGGVRFEDPGLISWAVSPGVETYDVVVGNLEILRLFGGDFGASLMDCLVPGTFNNFAFDLLPLGENESRYYLVRGQGCGPIGSYDSGEPSQVGDRDPGLTGGPPACP